MSMLAERKRKTKWVINPTKKPLWTTDSNGIKFGKGLMEKMGWSAGKGLGANEQGIQEPLKVSYKNDTKGMGFKGNDDDWIEHQDEFNCFLNQLRNCDESFVVKLSDAEKNEVKSLEEKSKWSKARVHYQKFTRGKDLSKYSENDLACILGTNKTKNEKSKVEEVIQPDSKINNNMETNFGVTTINSGSIQDYFKKKWIVHKKTKGEEGDEGVETARNKNSNFTTHEDADEDFKVKDEKKSKKKKLQLSSEECVETTITPESDDLEKFKKEKKKKKKKKKREREREREREIDSEEEVENKRKKNDFDLVNDFSEDVAFDLRNKEKKGKDILVENNDDCELEKFITKEEKESKKDQKKKKKKKDKEELKNKDPYCIENGVGGEEKHEVFEAEVILKKRKKSKTEKHLENDVEGKESCNISDSTNQCNTEVIESCLVVKKKKKKKDKKKESVEKEEVENYCSKNSNDNIENIKEANESEISSELVSKQKKKKDKKQKIESVANIKPSLEKENENTSIVEVVSEVESIKKKKKKKDKAERSDVNENKSTNEIESLSEVELNRKKNKKENKKESKEIENLRNSESDVNNCLEEKKNLKKRRIISENEPVKKKMKKSKKDKSLEIEDIELTENNSQTIGTLKINEKTLEIPNQREFSPKVESVKKKKHKKEKLIEKEEIDFVDNNTIKITNTSELTADKKKKKKKKDKMKETSSDYIEIEKSESCLKENNSENDEHSNTQKEKKVKKQEKNNFLENSCEAKESESKTEKKIEKTDIVNDKKLGFSTNKRFNYVYNKNETNFPLTSLGYSNNNYNSQFFNNGFLHQQNNISNLFSFLYSYNYFNNVLNIKNSEVGNGNVVQNHKIEFLNDKKADKFYPGQDPREKISRLIYLSDFSEFRGSNLEKLTGYGFLKHKIHNKPV